MLRLAVIHFWMELYYPMSFIFLKLLWVIVTVSASGWSAIDNVIYGESNFSSQLSKRHGTATDPWRIPKIINHGHQKLPYPHVSLPMDSLEVQLCDKADPVKCFVVVHDENIQLIFFWCGIDYIPDKKITVESHMTSRFRSCVGVVG